MVLRSIEGLDYIIVTKGRRFLGRLAQSIHGQWASIREKLSERAQRLRNREYDAEQADLFGLSGDMLDAKREGLDLALGRWKSVAEWNREIERLKKAPNQLSYLNPKSIALTSLERVRMSSGAFIDLLTSLIASIALLKGWKWGDFVQEFAQLIGAAKRIARKEP
jgi:hypothetical protein